MDRANHQGGFGEAFIRALAAAAALRLAKPEPDLDGIDFCLWPDRIGRYRGARATPINVQVKSSSIAMETDTHWRHRLAVPHFNLLADDEGTTVPTFLFLVIVPSDNVDYATATPDGMLLRNAAYWHSLAGKKQILGVGKNAKVTVEVPKANLLTVDSLRTLLSTPLDRVEAS